MGHALAAAFLEAGHPLTVWNRTPGKADGLVARGAFAADDVEGAVRASELVVACLMDYDAVRETIERAPVADAWAGRVLVNLSSGEPGQARALEEWAGERGITYLDGAVLTPVAAIGTPAAAFLYSGAPEAYASVEAALASLGGSGQHLGDEVGRAAAYELALLDLFASSVAGLSHAFALAGAEGIDPVDFGRRAGGIGGLLSGMAPAFGELLAAGDHSGDRATIASAASTVGHIIAAADAHGLDTGMLTAAKTVMDRAVAAGHGKDGYPRLVEHFGKGHV